MSYQVSLLKMPAQTCDLCHIIAVNKPLCQKISMRPHDLEKSSLQGTCVLCGILFRSIQHHLVDLDWPASQTTSSIFPDDSYLLFLLPKAVRAPVLARVFWDTDSTNPINTPNRGPFRAFELEIFTLLRTRGHCFLLVISCTTRVSLLMHR